MIDYLHQLDAAVAGGLSPPTFLSSRALALLAPLVPMPPRMAREIAKKHNVMNKGMVFVQSSIESQKALLSFHESWGYD